MSALQLSEAQKKELHLALVSYLANEARTNSSTTRQLCADLGVSEAAVKEQDPHALERKWIALVRLQRKLLDLEQQNQSLKQELKEAQSSVPATSTGNGAPANSIDNWLPRWPPKYTLEGHRGRVTSVAFHPTWSIVASGCDDGSIKLWDYEQGEIEQTVKAHTRAVHSVAFGSLTKVMVSCSADLSIRVWDSSRKFANTLTLVGHDHTVSAVTTFVDPETKKEYIASGSRDKTIRIWELATGFAVRVIRAHTDWVRALDTTSAYIGAAPVASAAYPQSSSLFLLSAGSDRTVRLTPLSEAASADNTSFSYEGHSNVVECCAIAPPSTLKFIARHYTCQPSEIIFASGGRDCTILIWASGNTEGPVLTLKGHDNWVQGLAFHPSGRFLVSVSDDKTMRIWDIATAKLCKTIPAHDHFVTSIAWHGKTIATGSVDQTVRIW